MLKSSPLNSVSFKLKSSLIDSISQSCLFLLARHSISPSLNTLRLSPTQITQQTQWNIKNQETQRPRERNIKKHTQRPRERNIKKRTQRSREKHQTLSPSPAFATWVQSPPPLRAFAITTWVWSLLFVFSVFVGLGFLFFIGFCFGFYLR